MRSRAERRDYRQRKIDRKKRIVHELNDYWVYGEEGRLSKGKIHCSCPMCRMKSYDEKKHSDKIKELRSEN